MSTKVFIFHGLGGSSKSSWIPWLKKEIEKRGNNVFVPNFPNSKCLYLKATLKDIFPSIKIDRFENWYHFFQNNFPQPDKDSILIGHSLGGVFLLKLLEKNDNPVKAAIFISPSIGITHHRFYRTVFDFTDGFSFEWRKIRSNASKFEIFHSDNDLTVPFENGKKLAQQLKIELNLIPNAGHFTAWSGYAKFPQLLEKLKPLLENK